MPHPTINLIQFRNELAANSEKSHKDWLDRATLKDVAGSPLKLGQAPVDVAVNTKTNRVYVTNWFQRKAHVLAMTNPTTKEHAVIAEIKAAPGAEPLTGWLGMTIDETRNLIYAARNFRSEPPLVYAVAVIDGATNTVIKTITHKQLFQPVDVALNAAGTRLYVAMQGNAGASPLERPGVAVFDLDPLTSAATYKTTILTQSNPQAIAAYHQRNQIYVTIAGGVQIIDDETLTITTTVPTGKFPISVAVRPASNHIYLGDSLEGTLTRLAAPDLSTIITWA